MRFFVLDPLNLIFLVIFSLGIHHTICAQDSTMVMLQDSIPSNVGDSVVTNISDTVKTMVIDGITLKKIDRSGMEKGKGTLRVIQDERINTLNDIVRDQPYKHDGFRIQVIFGSQELVNGAKAKFQARHSHATYKDYLAPNFRLRVGDFPTKQLAEKHLHKIRRDFPKSYIVKDKINSPRELRR